MYIGLDGRWYSSTYNLSLLIYFIGLAVPVPRVMLSPYSQKMTRRIQERKFTVFEPDKKKNY
jgi:hypothetical protein